MSINIAIDGPAGAGKSTIAKMLAARLGYIYVDTGAMYRAMGYYFATQGIAKEDEAAMSIRCREANIQLAYEDGVQQVLLNGSNVSDKIRTEEAGLMASACGKVKEVRLQLVALQQALAQKENVVMDGRDIGTAVLPNADLKVYLTASVETRARRRYDELVNKGVSCDLKEVEKDIIARDYQDMNREISPLRQAEDAVLVDTSHMTVEEVVNYMSQLANKAVKSFI